MNQQNQKWKNKTLESLEKRVWPELSEMDKQDWLMVECHALRKKPIKDFSIENLRQMIEQDIGLEFLIPFAIEKLEKDIIAMGECYEGDLLSNVLRSDEEYWKTNKGNWKAICKLFEKNKITLTGTEVSADIRNELFDNFKKFETIN